MTLLNVLAAAATLVATVFAIYVYVVTRRTKQLVFVFQDATIQTKNHPDITITFLGHEVQELRRTLLVCWNLGTAAIRRSDVPPGAWPTVSIPGGRIISATFVASSIPAIAPRWEEITEEHVSFGFEYLNHGDGVVLELLCDRQIAGGTLQCQATVIDGEETLVREWGPSVSLYSRGLAYIYLLVGVVLLVSALPVAAQLFTQNSSPVLWLVIVCGGAMSAAFVSLGINRLVNRKLIAPFAFRYFL